MQYVLILIGIWMIIAFIYSKVKNESFLKSIILIPLILLKFIFEDGSNYSKIEKEAKKQGRDDVLEKINNAKQANAQAASYAQQAVDKIKNKEE